jgi:uncharacterized protein YPO0396
MSSRAIQLSKLHAINWYGYQDSLPVRGNLVLAGVTGSGKSILMDLLMLVLVGPERARHHFNRSATGTQSDRTLKSYCLLDTKREENGQPQYFRDKGATTFVAAEFTWPDGSRVETWGLRIEFRNAAENDGHITPFYAPRALDYEDLVAVSELDGKRRPLDMQAFRFLLEQSGGRLFGSSREYAREMSSAAHLNFNRDVLDRLLPSAMSFTNLKSFDDFCRRFVLPGEPVPVEDVVASYRDFESYETELRQLKAQLTRLQTIRDLGAARSEARRDAELARYLGAELADQHARDLVASMERRLATLKEEFAGDEQRLIELEELITTGKAEQDRLRSMMRESSEGRLYEDLSRRARMMEAEIDKLRALQMRLDEGLRRRIKDARAWMKHAAQAPLDTPPDTLRLQGAIELLEGCEVEATGNALSGVREAADQLCQSLRRAFAPRQQEIHRLRSEKAGLEAQLAALKSGLPPVAQPLLSRLNRELPAFNGQPAARALRDVCEVADEAWREAVEVAFTGKFTVLVEPAHYALAAEIYASLEAPAAGAEVVTEGLATAPSVKTKPARVLPGSLAEKIETEDPAARALINDWYGQVICVKTLAEAGKHAAAVLPDGLVKQDGVLCRARHYDGVPFVGSRGLRRQLEVKSAQLGEVDARLRRLEPLEMEIGAILQAREELLPDHSELTRELVQIERLPLIEEEHEALMRQIQSIDSGSLREMETEAMEWQERVTAAERERLEIARKGGAREIEQAEQTLVKRREDADKSGTELARVSREIDISPFQARLEEWRTEMLAKFLVADAAAREFDKEASRRAVAAAQAEGDLKGAMVEFKRLFAPRFDDLPEDGRSVEAYAKLLERIDGQGIPEFEAKAVAERQRWEQLFRTQVLTRMQQALNRVEEIILLLNRQLKRPIGNDLYRIEKRPNPEFRFYRQLIDLNSLQQPDDLFFQNLEGELKTALEQFLQTLVRQANSPEAARLLDYRQYFDYDLLVTDVRHPDSRPVSVDKQSGKMSGGENQSPYFVAILASYLHAYNRHEARRGEPSLALVPIDEAFSKLSGERIQDCLAAMRELDLQGVFSMSSGNIPFAFSLCDELIVVTKTERKSGGKAGVRNVPAILFRDTPEGAAWMDRHAG